MGTGTGQPPEISMFWLSWPEPVPIFSQTLGVGLESRFFDDDREIGLIRADNEFQLRSVEVLKTWMDSGRW